MKRKRGHKKGNKAKANAALVAPDEAAANDVSVNSEDNSVNDEYESGMEVDTPPSSRTDQAFNVANINPDSSMDKPIGKSIGRVKVKLKTSSKVLESDVPSHSDTDKSSPQVGLERQGVVYEKMEDSANSSAEIKMGVSSGVSWKAGSIKIKSSRMLAGSNADKSGNAIAAERESSYQKEAKMPRLGYRYNKLELDSALTVIKKVMKMEAAAPFNEPVNPDALGIPDYFDIIDTPMDFGTICNNLENGDKYMDSEDVFKDVQYIWDNCCKYNNKGDAILDLMRRVKKNFMKYWTAAGLYTEQSKGANGADGGDVEDGAFSSQGKMHIKGSHSKMKKKHGRRHKSDCLCAICILKRRKREREANARMANKGQSGVQDFQQEESSPVGSLYGEDSSPNMDESVDPYADTEVEGEGEKVKREVSEHQYSHMEGRHEEEEDDAEEEEEEDEEENEMKPMNKDGHQTKEQSQFRGSLSEEPSRKSLPEAMDKSGAVALNQRGSTPSQNEEKSKAVQQQRRKDSQERQQRSKMLESFRFENPMLLNLCGILFPDNKKSVWSGPHSLAQNRGSRTSAIHAAIETFMK
ncbi:F-box/LRR-repeat protein [Hibiscus syriacus]|uniref:F-box/LRR-repeat protein n=1 Tax=Hibiscus syriacus TaxID=106335 RepID=A0A6A2WS38_HIBSY|nr:SWR1 complex bromodomain subunit bdf1-like [Hibiscus syriacus]XP_039056833.1 SWR1 complex bromodomain subunit bdf1-like [Hibiscus syriacus]XP_039056834.1 SWR1 complex bromodomain subunit bdf1-like [Hibiscus syriacus]KAE8663578.1 F-box/LRR-repeat protein [Hibiscus syriacus]KAE8727246.1 F-box/LRR-repeat protein [Hibiscus syriacus]